MKEELIVKLSKIIEKRKKNLVNIVQFDDLFYIFAKRTLKEITQNINHRLEESTQDFLKIYYDDPLNFINTQYFAQVQLSVGFSRNRLNLLSEETNPIIKFEGNETNGQVKISTKLIGQKEYKQIGSYGISELNEDKTFEIIVDFLEKVFS